VFLGGYETSIEQCLCCFHFDEISYYDEDLKRECIAREANVVPLVILSELMSKIVGIEWDVSRMSTISSYVAGLKRTSPPVDWFSNCILKEDGMIDVFRYLFPNAKGRYTCWNQQTNCRFQNIGTRIDYTIVDEALLDYIDNDGSQKLRCCHAQQYETNFTSEEAGFDAAVASGLFQGASFEGGGIAPATPKALETQFGEPHTGIIYTAPQYSDHVAVSLLLNERFDRLYVSSSLVLNGKETKLAQPHKKQQSISSFFSCSSSNMSSSKTYQDSSSTTTTTTTTTTTNAVSAEFINSSNSSAGATFKRKEMEKNQKVHHNKKKGTILAHFSKS